MKLFCTSDIHSFFMPFKKALDDAGFIPNCQEQLLIVCGDCFDRGHESNEVLEYLNRLTNVVLIRGNHEDLLEDVWRRGYYLSHDISNGTQRTINDIYYKNSNLAPYTPIEVSEKVLKPFLNRFVDYYETANFICTHSWLPYFYDVDWRKASNDSWREARWGNPFKFAKAGFNTTNKKIIFGHWHTSWPRAIYDGKSEFGENADFSPYYINNCIGLDACTAVSNICNVLTLEDDLL